ncbi:putative oxidoreductase subunit with NAD(P)-binding domain and ferridoxin-like domain [Methylocella tundrae]|uniref:Putative oxidoreductase subunit with NAD(P)-binding domain and ferridoxin-like domain n=1 Tax=Methylocella tundrae TaxID=227605 RepID=A0A8B6MC99_METTU|nr:LutB/LldF family L-lactate oxidation iron-sulfur protein [Methylocella tundrae]VTZ52572.1 putative oxidoreductase subunit with NAD(P)-binding domain and ferridoxin-like domain [Methylocella tundrae]
MSHEALGLFETRVEKALANPTLKTAIERTTGTAREKRAAAVAEWPDFAKARDLGRRIKDHVVRNLDYYLTEFERNALASGAKVHWATSADEACRIVLDICRAGEAKSVTRSKSMLGEEIGLPQALDESGIRRVETDLAEHIVQLAGDRPSHIIWPALHRTREEVSALFRTHHQRPPNNDDVATMVASARRELRQRFLDADVGISGANFLIADTGGVCVVTNEGNAELTTTLPRVHIVTAGIEKLAPSMQHVMVLLRLLVRSATGADITQYTTFHRGPKRPGDPDGPEEFHIVLIDNGRTEMLAGGLADMLRCLRCGACMNHCVVFRQIGGHAYGGVYPGPMGAVLTPALDGLKEARDLAHACTLNGSCQEVCPVDIPLPTLLRGWREKSWREGLEPRTTRSALGLWAFGARHPFLYRIGAAVAVRAMRRFSRNGWIKSLPLAKGWTQYRDFPKPAARTFMEELSARQRGRRI